MDGSALEVGSAAIRPHVVGNALIFVQRHGRTVRDLVYDFQVDGYIARDLTLVADHVTLGGVVELAYQAEPAGIVWAARRRPTARLAPSGRCQAGGAVDDQELRRLQPADDEVVEQRPRPKAAASFSSINSSMQLRIRSRIPASIELDQASPRNSVSRP